MKVENAVADPYRPALGALMPLIQPMPEYTREQLASTFVRILLEAGGNAHRFYSTHSGYQARLHQDPLFPSPDTLRRCVIKPESEPGSYISHDVDVQDQRHGILYLAQLRLFAADVGLKDGDFYITLDGSPMVKFGDKAYETSRPIHTLSEAAMWARPINRSKRDSLKPHPFFRGSTGGFEFLHCTLHTIDGKISMTVYVDMSPKFSLATSTRKCMDALAAFGLKPAWIVADKEFTGNGAVWEVIRDYADHPNRSVLVLGPHVRRAKIVSEMQRCWDDHLFQSAKYAGRKIWWAFLPASWSRDSKGYRPFGVVVVFEEVNQDFMPDDPHGVIVNQGEPGVKPRVCAFPIQVNKVISTEAEFIGVFEAVPRRWACEALFQRHEMRFARSKSSDLLPRQVYYNFSLALVNCYGHWRAKKRQLLGREHRVALGMSWWMGDLRACIDYPELIGRVPLLTPQRRRTRWSS